MVGLLRRQHARSARRGSGCRRRGRAPSGSRRAAAARPAGRRPARRDRPRARIRAPAAPARRAPRRAPRASSAPPSAPSTTFSSTVKGSTSMKCWCTMPMPAAMASCGLSDARPACRRRGSRRCRPGRGRRGSTSGSTCRRRSRRRCRGSCRAATARSMSGWHGPRRSACRCRPQLDRRPAAARSPAAADRRAMADHRDASGADRVMQALSLM